MEAPPTVARRDRAEVRGRGTGRNLDIGGIATKCDVFPAQLSAATANAAAIAARVVYGTSKHYCY